MDKYPRTHLGFALAILLIVMASLPASAQNGRTHSNTQQAELNIKAKVERTVMLPPVHHSAPRLDSNVTYNMPAAKPDVEVKEEIQSLPAAAIGNSEEGRDVVLRTLTVVVH